MPRFALRAGLVARAQVADKGLLKHSRRGGTGGGGTYYCGGCGGGRD